MTYDICMIPGDGIGPEVIASTREVLDHLATGGGPSFNFQTHLAGFDAYSASGDALPGETLRAAKACDAVLVGAMDVARLPAGVARPLGELRRELEVGASLRPARSRPGVRAARGDVDVLFVREVTEGLYSHIEYRAGPDAACAVRLITREASTRTARIAFEQARTRAGRVTAVHKLGALAVTDGLFLAAVEQVAETFPDVDYETRNVDACALELIQHPAAFDVILTTNAFGDILSDVGAGLVGGLGLAPSACVGERWAYFEPVHGTAPDITGQGIANPMATILSSAMMLRHLGEDSTADAIERAVERVLADGTALPRDLGGDASSSEVTQAIVAALPR